MQTFTPLLTAWNRLGEVNPKQNLLVQYFIPSCLKKVIPGEKKIHRKSTGNKEEGKQLFFPIYCKKPACSSRVLTLFSTSTSTLTSTSTSTMPEGPSIVLLKEEVKKFAGKKIISVNGNSKIDQERLRNKTILSFESWGKHFLICFKEFTLRIHFLMFGSYRVNEKKETPVRLSLNFRKGEINFYSCSIKFLEGDIHSHYDFSLDVMNDGWNPKAAKARLKQQPEKLICDALLEQDLFAGVGNIIKNEVLYRVRIHPECIVRAIPSPKLRKMVEETRIYSFDFLEWKRNYVLKKHWLAHTKKICLRCNLPILKKYTGVKNRRSFFCPNCQRLYT